jgi:predicted transcriptional regulator
MDVLYRIGTASAAEVHRALEDPPTATTIRGLLRILEEKGHVTHEKDGLRYLYRPAVSRDLAAAEVLPHVIRTYFGGSPSRALASLLGRSRLDEDEIDRLSNLVEQAKKGRR